MVLSELVSRKSGNSRKLLLRIARRRDAQALDSLYGENGVDVYRFFLYLLLDSKTATQWTCDTFLMAFRKADTFDIEDDPVEWLFWVAHRIALDGLKSYVSKPRLAQLSVLVSNRDQVKSLRRLAKEMDNLKPHYRIAMILREFRKFSYRTIASIMEVDVESVKTWISRARIRLAHDTLGDKIQ